MSQSSHAWAAKTRNAIIEYLMDIGDERKSEAKEQFILPDLAPKDFVNQFRQEKR